MKYKYSVVYIYNPKEALTRTTVVEEDIAAVVSQAIFMCSKHFCFYRIPYYL